MNQDNNKINMQLIKLKDFLDDFPTASNKEITMTTTIEKDLRITGTDAVEFIIAYGIHFNVDVSQFKAAKYFDAEGDGLMRIITRYFFPKKKENKLTIEHLVNGIINGKLNDSTIKTPSISSVLA